jgi:hypothetical protein
MVDGGRRSKDDRKQNTLAQTNRLDLSLHLHARLDLIHIIFLNFGFAGINYCFSLGLLKVRLAGPALGYIHLG